MKTTLMFCALGLVAALTMISSPLTANSENRVALPKPKVPEQKLVRIYESESTYMKGDPDCPEKKRGNALPVLLEKGWRIVDLQAGATGTSLLITTGYVLLER